ncbi:MAG: hypothetical protein E7551_07720 [Ruminococcaceae bacterium]|nr:hypothetical protein [Oscillospiraceae bacterium]
MKKFISIIYCLLMFTLVACSGNSLKQITVAEAGYTCNGFVKYGENFSSNITVNAIGGGIFSLEINTPEDISGLTFSFDNSEMKVTYNGLEYSESLSPEYGGFSEILNQIFLKFTTSRPIVSSKDGKFLYEGNNSNYYFVVEFNEEGFPLSISVEDEGLVANFSNWRY